LFDIFDAMLLVVGGTWIVVGLTGVAFSFLCITKSVCIGRPLDDDERRIGRRLFVLIPASYWWAGVTLYLLLKRSQFPNLPEPSDFAILAYAICCVLALGNTGYCLAFIIPSFRLRKQAQIEVKA
jgi:hypothetical protein